MKTVWNKIWPDVQIANQVTLFIIIIIVSSVLLTVNNVLILITVDSVKLVIIGIKNIWVAFKIIVFNLTIRNVPSVKLVILYITTNV